MRTGIVVTIAIAVPPAFVATIARIVAPARVKHGAAPTAIPTVQLSPSDLSTRCYNARMRISSGKVVDGRVELDGELPEGASVTVLATDGDETFEADAETEQLLLQAIDQCNQGKTTPMPQLLTELRTRE
jgi:hypothetical protein